MSRSQLDGKIQFKFFLHMNVHVKCSSCVLKISNVHFLSLSLDYRMRCEYFYQFQIMSAEASLVLSTFPRIDRLPSGSGLECRLRIGNCVIASSSGGGDEISLT